MLSLFIFVPLAAGLLSWAVGRRTAGVSRWLSLAANLFTLGLAAVLWLGAAGTVTLPGLTPSTAGSPWMAELSWPWIPGLGIGFSLGLDGLSLTMLALTGLLGAMAVLSAWKGITERVPFFHMNLGLVLAGINGVFLATDLFLFVFFWELMLIPMYFLIDLWGHENRHKAAVKFFLFTQIGGLLMLVAVIALVVLHAMASGTWTFALKDLMGTVVSPVVGMLLMLGFFAAFAVKLPAFPLHTWLPDAHTEAPTAGSVILAGLLLKTGGYGLIRFAVPLFPQASRAFAPVAIALAAAGIVYGGVMAFSQKDMKRVVAYTSVSHLGFVLLGLYAFTAQAVSGAVLQMVSHGISTGALFMLVGSLQDRIHTRELDRMGGLWAQVPRMGAAALVLAMALVGLPGLVNFVSEFLVLVGTWPVSPVATVVAGAGLVVATVYALRLFQGAFHGAPREKWTLTDLDPRETGTLFLAIALLVFFGLYPMPILHMVQQSVSGVLALVSAGGSV
ncbi:MAG TPA: NADH-quinone oxidoreductase subunit M [Spirochaetia bacterium]|nr:NADH-quinone oxidoreductase subunit M [Spirochaetia bacterium]